MRFSVGSRYGSTTPQLSFITRLALPRLQQRLRTELVEEGKCGCGSISFEISRAEAMDLEDLLRFCVAAETALEDLERQAEQLREEMRETIEARAV